MTVGSDWSMDYWSRDWDEAQVMGRRLAGVYWVRYRVTAKENPVTGVSGWLVTPAE